MTQLLIGYWIRRHAQASESRVKELDIVTAEKYGSEFDDMLHKRLEKEIEELI